MKGALALCTCSWTTKFAFGFVCYDLSRKDEYPAIDIAAVCSLLCGEFCGRPFELVQLIWRELRKDEPLRNLSIITSRREERLVFDGSNEIFFHASFAVCVPARRVNSLFKAEPTIASATLNFHPEETLQPLSLTLYICKRRFEITCRVIDIVEKAGNPYVGFFRDRSMRTRCWRSLDRSRLITTDLRSWTFVFLIADFFFFPNIRNSLTIGLHCLGDAVCKFKVLHEADASQNLSFKSPEGLEISMKHRECRAPISRIVYLLLAARGFFILHTKSLDLVIDFPQANGGLVSRGF